jgi:hypothetical protein
MPMMLKNNTFADIRILTSPLPPTGHYKIYV